MTTTDAIIDRASRGALIGDDAALALEVCNDLPALQEAARHRKRLAHGNRISYSPKVFIPLTKLCRDVCRYCTFAHKPRELASPYMTVEEAVAIAAQGAAAGCHEALFTLGDRPESRYRVASEALDALGQASTIEYLAFVAEKVHAATDLLPHVNPGVMSRGELERGGPHYGCPDKRPRVRLDTIRAAGALAVPFTSGLLIGIGETRRERIESMLALRALHARYGHVQEIIIQNFRAKAGTAMADAPEPTLDEHLWTIAVARLVFAPEMNVQAPPNLNPAALEALLAAGINDWGGVSPVTRDHVNPEAPWPGLDTLRAAVEAAGEELVPRLPVYPRFVHDVERWIAPRIRRSVRAHSDAEGYAREDGWMAGAETARVPSWIGTKPGRGANAELGAIVKRARDGRTLPEVDIVRLFSARGREVSYICRNADELRREVNGDRVTYVVNRNINDTNVCYFHCRFCAFSKGRNARDLRGSPYDLDRAEIARRTREAWQRGGTEMCLQGGIHPDYDGETYIAICRTVKQAAAQIHVHAFSPLEVWQGARTLDMPVAEFLAELQRAGLGSLPGTAAEILDDEVRRVICPDKITTAQWLEVMRCAHAIGLRSTATIMFGHVDHAHHWARHLLRIRELQASTGGFTEFVPLPFVHMQTPLYRKGLARRGPSYREALLMHAVARLALHPHVTNIQTSWVKMGPQGARDCLSSGANDLGGTLMNESITRAAGAAFGQELPPRDMQQLITGLGRVAVQRTTLYGDAPVERAATAMRAAPLREVLNSRPQRRARPGDRHLVRFGQR